jgi:hypothetical protein
VTEVPSPLDPPELSGAPSAGAPGRVSSTGGGVLTGNVERGGVGGAAEPVVAGYWVLIVSERPLVATEVTEQLRRLSRDGRGPAVLDRIAAELAWDVGATAMYVAAVAVRP